MRKSIRIFLTGSALMALLLGNTLAGYTSPAKANARPAVTNEAENDGVAESRLQHSDANEGENDRTGTAIQNQSEVNENENDGVPESDKHHSDANEGEADSSRPNIRTPKR